MSIVNYQLITARSRVAEAGQVRVTSILFVCVILMDVSVVINLMGRRLPVKEIQ